MFVYKYKIVLEEICALLGIYAAQSGGFLLTFWDNVAAPKRQ